MQVLLPQLPLLDRMPHGQQSALDAQRLLQEVEGAQLGGAHRPLDAAVAADHDHRRAMDLGQHLQSIAVGQPDVEQHEIEVAGADRPQPRGGIAHSLDLVPLVAEHPRQRLLDSDLVIHHQNSCLHAYSLAAGPGSLAVCSSAGSSMMNRAPIGALSSARSVPPFSSTMRCTIASPKPVPRPLVEKYGRNSRCLASAGTPCPVSATTASTLPSSCCVARVIWR